MITISNAIISSLSSGFSYLVSNLSDINGKNIMEEIPTFGADDWQKHLRVNLNTPDIPERLQKAREASCPFWPNKQGKETHILCLVPKDLTEEELRNLVNSKSTSRHTFKEAYWILITKKTTPNTAFLPFEAQKKCLSQNGYDIPSKLEAIIAVLAVKYLTGISIYSTRDDATRCSEKFNNNSYWAVGSDSSGSFCLYGPDSYILNDGVAAVIRS